MAAHTVSLRSRSPATVLKQPIQFSIQEIQNHFCDGMDAVRAQYAVADDLVQSGKIGEAKTIWRSQVVLAEGQLDFYIHEISKRCMFKMFKGEMEESE